MTDSHKLLSLILPQNTTLSPTQNADEVSLVRVFAKPRQKSSQIQQKMINTTFIGVFIV
jgi:hypothetical protein